MALGWHHQGRGQAGGARSTGPAGWKVAMRRLLAVLLLLVVSGGCTALLRALEQRPPREQLVHIPFPLPAAHSKVEVSGVWLRAINLAMDDFLPPGKEAKTPADACLFQRENYD